MAKAKTAGTMLAPLTASHRMRRYNLGEITPEYVNSILRQAQWGRMAFSYDLHDLMLDTWPRYRQNVNKMTRAISRLKIEIKPGEVEGQEEPTPRALAIYEVVERALESVSPRPGYFELGTAEAMDAILECEAKGPVALEIVWQLSNNIWSPRCYIPFPGRSLGYPYDSNMEDRLMWSDFAAVSDLKDFEKDRALIGVRSQGGVHPLYSGAMRPLVKYWMAAVFGMGWYMQYVQLFGIPWRTIKTDGTPDAMDKGEEFLANIGSSGTAVTNQDFELTLHDGVSGSANSLPQAALIELANKTCDLIFLGQSLTTDVADSGSRALGDVHADTLSETEKSRADWLSNFLTDQWVPAVVRMNFGEVPAEEMPYAVVEIPEIEDDKAQADRVKILQEIGVPMAAKWVYETLGVPEPQPGEALFGQAQEATQEPLGADPDPMEEDDTEEMVPTEEMAAAAQSAIEANRALSIWARPISGLGASDISRARDIANLTALDRKQIERMGEFFTKHESERISASWNPDSKLARRWLAYGGDAGCEWVQAKLER